MSNKKIQFSLTHKFLQSHEFGCNFLHDFIGASIDGHGTDIPPCSGDGIFFKYTKITEKVKTAVSHSFHHLAMEVSMMIFSPWICSKISLSTKIRPSFTSVAISTSANWVTWDLERGLPDETVVLQ